MFKAAYRNGAEMEEFCRFLAVLLPSLTSTTGAKQFGVKLIKQGNYLTVSSLLICNF